MIKGIFESWNNGLSSLLLASEAGQDEINKAVMYRKYNPTFIISHQFTNEIKAKKAYKKLWDKLELF